MTDEDVIETEQKKKSVLEKIREDVINILIPRVKEQLRDEKMLALFNDDIKYYVNPTGKFVETDMKYLIK